MRSSMCICVICVSSLCPEISAILDASAEPGPPDLARAGEDVGECSHGLCAVSLLQHSAVVHQQRAIPARGRPPNSAVDKDSKTPEAASMLSHWRVFMRDVITNVPLIDGLPADFTHPALTATWICCAFYTVCVVRDVSKLFRLFGTTRRAELGPDDYYDKDLDKKGEWSALGIWMLCCYRLYTGFLAATWLPYVLAMEGETLWPNNQSLFMGIAKLIYGVTVLMNPMFGLIGDMLAEICQGAARRLWILLGIVLSAFGIMACLWAGPRREFFLYMGGITLWRLGESLNDVTTEAIVPELVPTRQFALASSIRAASFLIGGLLGYVLLYFLADVHYTWCYFAYLGCMFVFAVPSLVLLVNDLPAQPSPFRQGKTFAENMKDAYIIPSTYPGGFPEICFAIFIMSCGTAPIYFFLLIIRDLLGVHNQVTLTDDFAIGSCIFFLCAAAATGLDATYGGRAAPSSRGAVRDSASKKAWQQERIRRLDVLVILSIVFALSVMVLPVVQFFPTVDDRIRAFYPLIAIFGFAFGLAYSRFQDMTWRLLPDNCDMANAMGFNVTARNFGLGVGNFFFGALLDAFKVHYGKHKVTTTIVTTTLPVQELTSNRQMYTATGYDVMCGGCMIFNLWAGYIAWRIRRNLPDPERMAAAG